MEVRRFEEENLCSHSVSIGDVDGLHTRSSTRSRIDGGARLGPPLWVRVILKLPIPNLCIPEFLERRFPSLMALLCYGYLPFFIIAIYMFLTPYIMMEWFAFPWNYIALFTAFAPFLLSWLKVLMQRDFNYLNAIMNPSTVWDSEKTLQEYIDIFKKQKS
jgi:hypothetical protein